MRLTANYAYSAMLRYNMQETDIFPFQMDEAMCEDIMSGIPFIMIFILTVNSGPLREREREKKTFKVFLSMTENGWSSGGACLPATLLAMRHVNERAGILD